MRTHEQIVIDQILENASIGSCVCEYIIHGLVLMESDKPVFCCNQAYNARGLLHVVKNMAKYKFEKLTIVALNKNGEYEPRIHVFNRGQFEKLIKELESVSSCMFVKKEK